MASTRADSPNCLAGKIELLRSLQTPSILILASSRYPSTQWPQAKTLERAARVLLDQVHHYPRSGNIMNIPYSLTPITADF